MRTRDRRHRQGSDIGRHPIGGRRAGVAGLALACALWVAAAAQAASAPERAGRADRTEASVVVSLRHESRVRGPEIRLGEIADFRGQDAALIERLRTVEVARAPLPGLTRNLDVPYLKSRLRLAQIELASLAIDAPPSVSITTASRQVTGEELLMAVREYIVAARPGDSAALSIHPTGALLPALVVPDGQLELKVRSRPGVELVGTVSPTVDVWVDGVMARSVNVSVRVGVLSDMLVAARALVRGHAFTPDDVRIERRELAAGQEPLREPIAIQGRVAIRHIAQGEPILASVVDDPPLVRRGDIVLLTAEGRGVRATAQGEAKQDGRSGDVIRVRNLTSNRDVYGQVDAERSVRVQF